MKHSIKEFLKEKLPKEKLELVKRSFEIVGDIAITEIPDELINDEKIIGEAILKTNSSIKTVLKKSGIHEGEFRTQKLEYIAGENKKETLYKENGIKLLINPEVSYFSAKLSTEREIITNQIQENEKVFVMFSGVGPYSYVALKKQPNCKQILSVEINPQAHKYALKNKELNKNLLKHSSFFKTLREFFKDNEINFHETQLLKNYTNLKVHFFNESIKTFKLSHFKEDMKDTSEMICLNNLLKHSPKHIVRQLRETDNKDVFIDCSQSHYQDTIPYFILFSNKFNFFLKYNSKFFNCSSEYEKSLLLEILEQEKISFEQLYLFDRIIMPLPKDASNFLPEAFSFAKKGATIHMYDFVHESEFPHVSEQKIIDEGKKHKRLITIKQTRKVGQYSPGKYRVCCDFIIED